MLELSKLKVKCGWPLAVVKFRSRCFIVSTSTSRTSSLCTSGTFNSLADERLKDARLSCYWASGAYRRHDVLQKMAANSLRPRPPPRCVCAPLRSPHRVCLSASFLNTYGAARTRIRSARCRSVSTLRRRSSDVHDLRFSVRSCKRFLLYFAWPRSMPVAQTSRKCDTSRLAVPGSNTLELISR